MEKLKTRYNILFVVLLCVTGCMESQKETMQEKYIPSHHTEKGYRNPWPGFEERGFGDFLKWIFVERRKKDRKQKKSGYIPEKADNDGAFLRSNKDDFTVTFIGHSTLLFQLQGLNILTDPTWSERASPIKWMGPKRHSEPGIKFEDLPPVHVVLITHNHYDHLDKRTIKRLGNDPFYIIPSGLASFFEKLGISSVREMDWWESAVYRNVEFICTPAQHFSGRGLFDRNRTLWCSWIIRGNENNIYFAGDTGYFPGFKEIGGRHGPFDIVCLPIGAYLPRWFMGPVHLSPGEALDAYHDLGGHLFLAVHWGAFRLADDPPGLAPAVLLDEIEKRSLNKDKFWLLKNGETRNIDTAKSY